MALLLYLCGIGSLFADDETADASGYDKVRIENEYKLVVPEELTENVWSYLQERYHPEHSFLKTIDSKFNVELSDENFIDRYFDTPNLKFIEAQSGIRHRTREIPGDINNKKHGRSLVQLKLARADDEDKLNRSEIKFKVDKDLKNALELPLEKLVKEKDQAAFRERLQAFGVSITDLSEKIRLFQKRRRVYISLGDKPFATVTLDQVSAKKLWKRYNAVEIEIELNEINFTQADEASRRSMSEVSARIKADILEKFPQIYQDQTPKYNKAHNYFASQGSIFKFLVAQFGG